MGIRSGGNGAHVYYARVMEKLNVNPNDVDIRTGIRRPQKPVMADPKLEAATNDDISDFVAAVKAAKESRSTRPKGWRRFIPRARSK